MTHTYTHIHKHMNVYMYIYIIHVHTEVHIHTYIHTYMHIHVCILVCNTHRCTHIYMYMYTHIWGAPKQGVCNRARAHSRCIPRYIGYVSKGVFCDNPSLQTWYQKYCSKKARTSEQELLDLEMWSCRSRARHTRYIPPPMFCISIASASQHDHWHAYGSASRGFWQQRF